MSSAHDETNTRAVRFANRRGSQLAGYLDTDDGVPTVGYALFAHCFTCSKDVHAALRISRGLASRGFPTLRFDFTGLGASEGEFSDSHFSSNVADLQSAADFLRREHRAPTLSIGHSLGGAAVLRVAGELDSVCAVATIAAPAEPSHVLRLLESSREAIIAEGVARVRLAGRTFEVTREFLEDLEESSLRSRIESLDRPLLVFHAPEDTVVGIDNAAKIFQAAKHPKSFVSLAGADHLLTDRADAAFVADLVSCWARRYVVA